MEDEARERLIAEIMILAFAVDRRTPYAVFIDYSGHVENLNIRIVESKENWRNEVASATVRSIEQWHPFKGEAELPFLEAKRQNLLAILKEHDVQYADLEQIETVAYEYEF